MGSCVSGTRVCNSTGTDWGKCSGAVVPTIESCQTSADENCDAIGPCNGDRKWLVPFHVNLAEFTSCLRAAIDPDGNIVMTGHFEDSIDFGLGALAAPPVGALFVLKLDRDGKPIWNKAFGGATCVPWEAESLAIDVAGKIVLTGELMGSVDFGAGPTGEAMDLFMVKLEPDGSAAWSQTYEPGIGSAGRRGVDVDSSGSITLAGNFASTLALPGGKLDSSGAKKIFVARSGTAGTPTWAKGFVGKTDAYYQGGSLRSTAAGGSVLAIQGSGLDFGGGPLPCSGDCLSLAKLDSQGSHVWSKSFGGDHSTWRHDMELDAAGNLFLAGTFSGTLDFGIAAPFVGSGKRSFFAKLSAEGAVLQATQFAASTQLWISDLAVDAAGNPLLAGQFTGVLDLDTGPLGTFTGWTGFVAKLDGSGSVLWSSALGGTKILAVADDPLGDVVTVGRFAGTVDLGGGPVECKAASCLFIEKHAP